MLASDENDDGSAAPSRRIALHGKQVSEIVDDVKDGRPHIVAHIALASLLTTDPPFWMASMNDV